MKEFLFEVFNEFAKEEFLFIKRKIFNTILDILIVESGEFTVSSVDW